MNCAGYKRGCQRARRYSDKYRFRQRLSIVLTFCRRLWLRPEPGEKGTPTPPNPIHNIETRIEYLEKLRKDIKNGEMPKWMIDELTQMQNSFPKGSSIRCRSSTNNEDLSDFNGAGLYDSKTQKPEEGHISKSIKEVFASIWNFRAFEERDFYKISHIDISMAVLCHLNETDEKLNGVGVSVDPFYYTNNTFYLSVVS